jgi:hypothetical protein
LYNFKKRAVFGLRMLTLIASGGFVACSAEQADPVADAEGSVMELNQSQWSFCARQGQRCEFSGKRRVRYGNDTDNVVKSFSDGVDCSSSAFGTKHLSGNCSLMTHSTAMPAAGAGAHVHAGSDAASMPLPTAGMAPHAHAGSAATSMPTAGSSEHVHGAAGGGAGDSGMNMNMAMAPHIDLSAIPTGSAGSSQVQIAATSEQPGSSDGTGAFRNECAFSHMSFNDPIVFPGQPGASHLHAFFGNTGVDANSTPDSIRNSGNSTCRGGIANRTGYWAPALLDGAGRPIKPSTLEVYYKSGYNGIKANEIKPFPSGLRMLAGSAKSTAAQGIAYWGCHDHYIGHKGSITDCAAGDSVQMTVEFPQCWDGTNLDSADHKSHMSYTQGGRCPATHPVAIPAISFNILYAAPSNGSTAGWRLASDMYDASLPGGFSAHADWFDGWDPAVVKAFVEHCINPALDCHSHLLGDGRRIY